ncbi:B-cell receptor-associated 31-like protein [Macrolepiota fuliginosa MF-IS2]|uniref:Endoplasmic reticulum transmembrane protein n=1 Tax=Macrolepiota fuliginosa MF-IS2 TaxID=1400762 RepID=A0A9P5XI44_9AGAR|nr:B-cell receptor-associated 31-like protein [Macrolepiota fuliginosa MF-IS2]
MTIHYSLTFFLLAAEMITFCLLVAPLPFAVRKRVFSFLSTSPIVAKIIYGLKISFIFVAILFADALQRMFRVAETELAKSGQTMTPDARAEANQHARKFYAQRNVYLTGFCLFLSLVLTRTFQITLELIRTQEEYTKLKKEAGNTRSAEAEKEIADLKKKLAAREAKELDFKTLKKQASQNSKEYDRLATELNTMSGSVSDKRRD